LAIVSVIQGLEWTFHTVAEEYNRWRPGYVPELYQDLFAYKPLNKSSSALEIGIGTGQATAPVLETGCALTAVELGDSLAEIARRKFSRYPRFTVIHTAFQAYARPDESFDLIYAAGSFHWIPEEIGYPKVYQMLKRGGAFARFAVHPYYRKGNEPMYTDIQKVYAAYMPRSSPSDEYTEEDARKRAAIGSNCFGREQTGRIIERHPRGDRKAWRHHPPARHHRSGAHEKSIKQQAAV
jgi:hypothetical protein